MDDAKICVGAIMGAFGVKGEMRIKSFCAEPADIATFKPLTDEAGAKEFTLKITRPIKGGFAARDPKIRFKDQADALKGTALYAARDQLPNLPDDEFYHSDLIGLDVLDTGGAKLGRIKAVFDHGAGDLLEITGPNLKGGILLPFTKEAVPTVDLGTKRVIIDPPEGVFPE
ncbi:MAG: ribosome maturation factor RimM [Pseudomonadota bacterium]